MIDYLGKMWELALNGDKQGIFFFASLYALLLIGYSIVYQLKITKWPVTKGILLDTNVEKLGATEWAKSNQDYKTNALYEYVVSGTEYRGKKISPWIIIASHNARFILEKQLNGIQRNEDGSINVFFNPNKPQKSFLIKPGKVGLVITSVMAVFPIILYWLTYYA